MLSLGVKFCAFPRCSRACFSLRRRAALSSEVCPATLFLFAARQKAHKQNMQYPPCENTFFQGARSRRRRRNEENKTKTGVSKTPEIQIVLFIGFAFFWSASFPCQSCSPSSYRTPNSFKRWPTIMRKSTPDVSRRHQRKGETSRNYVTNLLHF